SNAKVDYAKIASDIYREIGYIQPLEISVHIVTQSLDIAAGVDTGGAGDQGIMYGYATDETAEYLPKGVVLVHALAKRLELVRKENVLNWLRPDGKTQVTFSNGELKTILISTQHDESVTQNQIREDLISKVITPVLGSADLSKIEILTNPTGIFVQGGFEADTGLTGRKIIVDTYGGLIPHGGGSFSGKDATKVDRAGAYMARFVAKNLVAGGYGKECLVAVAYAIGMAEPLMIEAINEKGEDLSEIVRKNFDFRPNSIIETLQLRTPIFRKTATYGHFGKDDLPWEKIVKI
ncbi:MAG: methionine adenosyltransferase, partial [Candidatus Pacebacteria bacterium]|nr:methionine adenosyltransferase [Candidatus Paceibacterota bacterium]